MKKVLNIISDHNIGGAGKCVLIYSEHYNKEKFQLFVAVPKGSKLIPELLKRNVNYYEVEGIADKSLSLKGIFQLKKLIKTLRPDIVHTHASMSGRIAAKLCGVKKIIYTLHCVYEPSNLMKSFVGKILNKIVSSLFSTDIIAVAQAAADNLIKVGINPDKINVVLNGITPLKTLSDEEIITQRNRFGLKEGEKAVSIIARLEPVKGHKTFIDCANILKGKGIKFIIAGNGSYEAEIKEYAKETNSDVIFTGFISDPGNLIAISSLSANASYGTEATSISLLEGMSLGVPAVVSNYGGNPGVIKDGINGYLFPIHNAEIMAEKIEKLIFDEKMYLSMKENSLKIFNDTFTAEKYAENIEKVYDSGDK